MRVTGNAPQMPPLPCPECRQHGVGGMARIGNRRRICATCNTFAANVTRLAGKRLREVHADDYYRFRLQVERDLYPQVIEEWTAER